MTSFRMRRAGQGCLFIFHRVAASNVWASLPNRGFHIDAGYLGRLLDYVVETGWKVVTLDEAAARLRDGDRSRFVNFSIDDVYRDTGEAAVPVFRERGLPVTLFVTTGIPDRTMTLWTAGLESVLLDRNHVVLDDGVRADVSSPAQKRRLYAELSKAWEPDSPARHYARFCALNGADPGALHDRHAVTWDTLEALRDDPCVEIGAHTMTHPRLSALTGAEARVEIAGSRARLQERLRLPVRHFAFPYGRRQDCGEREFALVREAGFDTAATTRKGLAGGADRSRLHALPRNTLNGEHRNLALAELHLSGLSGLIARGMGAT